MRQPPLDNSMLEPQNWVMHREDEVCAAPIVLQSLVRRSRHSASQSGWIQDEPHHIFICEAKC